MPQFIVRLTITFIFTLFASAVLGSDENNDIILGNKNAPIEVIEYMSLTCSHCAQFHNESLSKIKPKYIDTGKIKLILRDFPLDGIAYQASMISHCVSKGNPERYYGFVQYLFEQQRVWTTANEPLTVIKKMALLAGLNSLEFSACLENKSLGNAILKSRQSGEKKYDIKSTPTLIVNGTVYPGGMSFEKFEQTIKPLLSE